MITTLKQPLAQARQCRNPECGNWFYDVPGQHEGFFGVRWHDCDDLALDDCADALSPPSTGESALLDLIVTIGPVLLFIGALMCLFKWYGV